MPQPTQAVAAWQLKIHPLTDRAFWDKAAADAKARELLERAAAIPRYPDMICASDYLAAKRFNDRARIDQAWHHLLATLDKLSLRRALLGMDENDPDDRLLDWLWAGLNQPTWVLSAHLPGNDLPASGSPQLDLVATGMAMHLAELREVLGPWIDSVSDTLGQSIVAEIDRRVLTPFADGAEAWWAPIGETTRQMNNWSGVCGGAILGTCESLAAQGYPRPKAKARAIQTLQLFFDQAFTPGGECDEGISYWNYGIGVAMAGLSRLSPQEITQHFDMDRIASVADYPRRVHLFNDAFFSGNDAPLRLNSPPWFAAYLGALVGNDWLLQWSAGVRDTHCVSLTQALRKIANPNPATSTPVAQRPSDPAVLLKDQQVAILRLNTPKGEMLATLSGGDNAERHNHNDLGHFMIALADRFVLPDLGNMLYTADFFGPKRYTYMLASSRGHNCPVIGGHEQRPGHDAIAQLIEWNPEAGRLSLDLTAAYPPDAGLIRWTRTLTRDATGYTLTDAYHTREPNTAIEHIVWTLDEPGPDTESLSIDGIRISLSPAADSSRVQPHDPTALGMREFTDRHPHRVAWHYRTNDEGQLRVETRIEPT